MHICRSSKKIMDKRFGIFCMVGAAILALAPANVPGQTPAATCHEITARIASVATA